MLTVGLCHPLALATVQAMQSSTLGDVMSRSLTGKHVQCSGGLMNYLPSKVGRGWPEALWKDPALTKVEKMHKRVGIRQRVRTGNEERKGKRILVDRHKGWGRC